jgi:hypothetical protein
MVIHRHSAHSDDMRVLIQITRPSFDVSLDWSGAHRDQTPIAITARHQSALLSLNCSAPSRVLAMGRKSAGVTAHATIDKATDASTASRTTFFMATSLSARPVD